MNPHVLMFAAGGALLVVFVLWLASRTIRAERDLEPVSDDWLAQHKRIADENVYQ